MQPYSFEFSLDASGSADAITLPQDFPSCVCTLRLKPPVGHAWTFFGPNGKAFELGMDEALPIGPAYRYAGETIGTAELDTGSGTGQGVAS